jgi:hypothetical protein
MAVMAYRTARVATEEELPAEYVTVAEAARRASLSVWTLYHLISRGALGHKQGVRRPGTAKIGPSRAVRIHWATFKARFLDFKPNGTL